MGCGSRGRSRGGVRAAEVFEPRRCSSRGGVRAAEVFEPRRCSSRPLMASVGPLLVPGRRGRPARRRPASSGGAAQGDQFGQRLRQGVQLAVNPPSAVSAAPMIRRSRRLADKRRTRRRKGRPGYAICGWVYSFIRPPGRPRRTMRSSAVGYAAGSVGSVDQNPYWARPCPARPNATAPTRHSERSGCKLSHSDQVVVPRRPSGQVRSPTARTAAGGSGSGRTRR
jgi:hypothetical protein